MRRLAVAWLAFAALGCDVVLGIRDLPRGTDPVDADPCGLVQNAQ